MATPNPMADPSSTTPDISVQELQMCGLMVDVYGLSELLPSPSASHITILWLHHPRLRSKVDMKPIACSVLSAFHAQHQAQHPDRGMIAIVHDQRNHGTRKVSDKANKSWRDGNATHAQDMYGVVAGCVGDAKGLMDAVEGYLFLGGGRAVDQHLVLGVSLGGHTAWQLMFDDKRVEAGVMVIGCPDFMLDLLKDRARRSKLETFKAEEASGKPFLGSNDFPPALVEACRKADPKALAFGTGPISTSPKDATEAARLKNLFDQHHLRGKRFLSCSGKDDKLVPYEISKPFMDFLVNAASTWYKDGGIYVEDKVYKGVGHSFSPGMVQDAVRFILDTVADKDKRKHAGGAKI
ncbi:hypothetical protein MKZ38_002129 [Zalerion maritima]|uniref:Uncharacterized protein n=1 Tax=Zalerion maritima TaxID=339359 RepID=A0AAD5WSQ9_9PEZI|nr:hypothetical protein MKZ38_002129 [Zalerion maritima]